MICGFECSRRSSGGPHIFFFLLGLPRTTDIAKLKVSDLLAVGDNIIEHVITLKELNSRAQGEVSIREALTELEVLVHCTMYTMQYVVYTLLYSVYCIHYTLYCIHYTLYSIHCLLSVTSICCLLHQSVVWYINMLSVTSNCCMLDQSVVCYINLLSVTSICCLLHQTVVCYINLLSVTSNCYLLHQPVVCYTTNLLCYTSL